MAQTPENNPFNKSQRFGQPHTIKWCAWDILLTLPEGIATEERIAEIIVERGLRTEIKATSIAKELGGDKNRFASSPEGWSIIPPIDDDRSNPIGPSRRSIPAAAAAATQAPKSPAKRKEPPESTLEEPASGRRRTKSTSEWWKVTDQGEQHGGAGDGGGLTNDEDEDIDIMSGAIAPAKSRDLLLLKNATKEQQNIDKKENDDDAGIPANDGEKPLVVAANEMAIDTDEPPPPIVAAEETIEEPKSALPASTSPQGDANKSVEKIDNTSEAPTEAPTVEDKYSKDVVITKAEKVGAAEPSPLLESKELPTAPIPAAPVAPPPPAHKGFLIPKRRSSAGGSTAPAPAVPAAPGVSSKDASAYNRNNRQSGAGSREPAAPSGSLRRPPSIQNITDPTAGTAGGGGGKPPLPRKKQPWETMLQEMNGAFARAWKRLEWPSSVNALPHPVDPASVTEEQKAAWHQAWSRFGAPPPPTPPEVKVGISTAPAANGAIGTTTNQEDMILHILTQDPYPEPPPEYLSLRIMQCSSTTEQQCLDRKIFVSNHRADTDGIEPGRTLVILHNFDKRIIYGFYRAVEVGKMLDPTFARDFAHHVRVEPYQMFSPLPSYLLEAFLTRKINKFGEQMKFFEKGTPAMKEVWHLMQLYSGKGFRH